MGYAVKGITLFYSTDLYDNMVTSGTGTANHSGTPVFTTCFSAVHFPQSLVFGVVFCRSLFL